MLLFIDTLSAVNDRGSLIEKLISNAYSKATLKIYQADAAAGNLPNCNTTFVNIKVPGLNGQGLLFIL